MSKANVVEVPTRKSAFNQVKKSFEPVVAGAAGGSGVALGEVLFGDIIGPAVGGIGASLFVKNEIDKRIIVVNAVQDTMYRILE